MRTLGLALLAGCVLSACRVSGPSVARVEPSAPVAPPPGWVLRAPTIAGKICGVGSVGPTYYRQDGRLHAGEAARDELARTIEVDVVSVMYDEQTTRGQHVDQVTVQQVTGSFSEVVLSGAQVVEVWFDASGVMARAGSTFALACMGTDMSVAELADRIRQAADEELDPGTVKRRAEVLFGALEQHEAVQRSETASSTSAGSGR